MESYSTEEQQVEAIKSFLKENGPSIVIGAVVGIGGLFGWRYYNEQLDVSAELNSTQYESLVKTLVADEANFGEEHVNFTQQNKELAYSQLLSLQIAKAAVQNSDFDQAVAQLTLVKDNAVNDAIRGVATIRLARILLVTEQYDAAATILEADIGESWKAQQSVLKGDLLVAKQDFVAAKKAYQDAIANESLTNTNDVQMKLDALAAKQG